MVELKNGAYHSLPQSSLPLRLNPMPGQHEAGLQTARTLGFFERRVSDNFHYEGYEVILGLVLDWERKDWPFEEEPRGKGSKSDTLVGLTFLSTQPALDGRGPSKDPSGQVCRA